VRGRTLAVETGSVERVSTEPRAATAVDLLAVADGVAVIVMRGSANYAPPLIAGGVALAPSLHQIVPRALRLREIGAKIR